MGPTDVVVIGAGQAGLAISHELIRLGVAHVVLERGRLGATWRGRWESFCLVTPNWTVQLPGYPYDGDDPDGYMPRADIVAYLERYAAGFGAPIEEGVEVTSLERSGPAAGFILRTTEGDLPARAVVVATGAYQRPHRPAAAGSLPAHIVQMDVDDYRSAATLPRGKVLIVGSGQSGCQIAEELRAAGREVYVACGRTPWAPRRVGGRDIAWWAIESGFFDQPLSALPTPAARLVANIVTSGHDGGHDLHLRTLLRDGVTLLGHFLGAEGERGRFAQDLPETFAWNDERYRDLMSLVQKTSRERGLPVPHLDEPEPFRGRSPEDIDLSEFGVALFCTGFRPDYRRWIDVPDAFDELGFPLHVAGESSATPGLFFVGVHFLRKRKSSLLYGVGEDAGIVAERVAGRMSLAA